MCLGIWGWVFITGYNTYKINMPFFNTLWGWAVDIKTFSVGIGIIIIMAHAFIWNAFINRNNILKQSSNFPAFFFVLLASCKSSLVGFYPSLLASFFLMLAIRRLAAGYKKEKALSEVFDAGIFVGIASLFYLPVAVFVLFLWIAILIMRSLMWREWVAALIGFILPFGFTLAYHYLFYTPELFWYTKLVAVISNYRLHWSFNWHEWMLILIIVPLCIASYWLLVNKMAENIVKTQKIWSLMLWYTFFASLSVVISPQRDAHSLIIFVMPVSLIFSNYFLKTKSPIWAEFLFICLLAVTGLNLFF